MAESDARSVVVCNQQQTLTLPSFLLTAMHVLCTDVRMTQCVCVWGGGGGGGFKTKYAVFVII